MKNTFLLITLFFVSFMGYAVQNDTTIVDSAMVANPSVQDKDIFSNLTFSFKNYKDKRTTNPLEIGSTTLKSDNILTSDQYIAIKYKKEGEDKWVSKYFSTSDDKMVIENLEENKFYDYYLGAGNDTNNITYNSEEATFNTLSFSVFENFSAKGKEEAGKIFWGLELDKIEKIKEHYPNASYIVKYNTKIGKKQNAADPEKSPWVVIPDISLNTVSYSFKNLDGGESYVYKVGIQLDEHHTVWSNSGKFSAERTWGIFKLLVLIGALGMFIFGMKIMSESLQQAAGSRLRNMLGSITSNRFKGVLTGFGITSIVQSSSVTTVMTVSFVNAGLMTLRQSAGVMMGANIGTTITGWLILIFGFKVSLSSYALIFIAFGAPLLFFSKSKAKTWAGAIIGFALLFMGLGELKHSVPELGADSALVQFFIDFKDVWYGPVMFVFLGALVTVVIQSSSAAMALTLTMVAGGVIPFEVASAMILGENIGTTITAELASLIGNVHAKRSARIHSLFNIIGVTWALVLFPFILDGIMFFIGAGDVNNPTPEESTVGLALFHTVFNTLNVIILIWFVPQIVRIAEKTVKSKGGADEEFHLDFIGTGILNTPELSILEAKKELAKFGRITSKMSKFTQQLLVEKNKKEKSNLYAKLEKYETITDRVEIEIANYLNKVSEGEMTEEASKRVRGMNSIANDLERIGDIFFQISKTLERKDVEKIWFSPTQRTNLQEMFKLIDEAFEVMTNNLNAHKDSVSIIDANNAEIKINNKRNELRNEYLKNMEDPEFNIQSGMIYNDIFYSCEKIGDHIINVTEAIVGEI
ncbi:Na/Pi cotransporter family protein [Lishizhenia sp.]|uniref:Na/Pi cotransporter family protein n=1 Tax=Lishizhenia sp. TaxID=2497594 RepID=UPI00299E96C1|nr:Na/Pi cotransporter family protein [Lishizhenia sp.]MDX1446875.1 Na/Pi cotransporter family protein [Lishizhenia sp.]